MSLISSCPSDPTSAWPGWPVFGYNCVPPTPFRLKDFDRSDVSPYVDPGCVPPEEGLPNHRDSFLVHRTGKRLPGVAQAFKEFILKEAATLLKSEAGYV